MKWANTWLVFWGLVVYSCWGAPLRDLEVQVGKAVNQKRVESHSPPVVLDEVLCGLARYHSQEMLKEGYFGHTSPNEMCRTTRDRLRVSHRYCLSSAENLHKTEGFSFSAAGEDAVRGWMESSGHRRNLLNPRFNRMGIGIAGDSRGMIFVQVLTYEPIVIHQLLAEPAENGRFRVSLRAEVAEGPRQGAIFFQGKRQLNWDAQADGLFQVELEVAGAGLLQIGQQVGQREWTVETEIPIPLRQADHEHR